VNNTCVPIWIECAGSIKQCISISSCVCMGGELWPFRQAVFAVDGADDADANKDQC